MAPLQNVIHQLPGGKHALREDVRHQIQRASMRGSTYVHDSHGANGLHGADICEPRVWFGPVGSSHDDLTTCDSKTAWAMCTPVLGPVTAVDNMSHAVTQSCADANIPYICVKAVRDPSDGTEPQSGLVAATRFALHVWRGLMAQM